MGRQACAASSQVNKIFILLTKIILPKSRDAPPLKRKQPTGVASGWLFDHVCTRDALDSNAELVFHGSIFALRWYKSAASSISIPRLIQIALFTLYISSVVARPTQEISRLR